MPLKEFIPLPEQKELYESVRDKVESQARRKVLGLCGRYHMGACHAIWSEMRRIYRDEYGIEWQSPAQLNPRVRFD